MALSEDSETRSGGRVQVESVASNEVLLRLSVGEGLDDIIETGMTPWSYKIQEARKDGVQKWWKYLLEGCALTLNCGCGFGHFTGCL